MQRWLHQHLFKVGWLVTKNFQTTTILYYTFFLPGVVIYELTVWLVAGMLDVRAERALHWPEPQEIGELRLNFVQLARRTSQWKNNLIQLSPLVTGLFIIWLIGTNVLNIPDVVRTVSDVGLSGVSDGIAELTRTTDFWLWAYLVFTIGNTMLPTAETIRSWRWLLIAAAVIVVPLIFLGVAEQILGDLVSGPLASLLDVLIAVFLIIIVFDLLGVAVLAIIENTIEYITGDSATFKNGKMIVMTREEAIAQRKRERELARRRQRRAPATQPAGPPSIYNLAFPIPGPPGQEPVTSIRTAIVEPEAKPELPPARREEPTIISAASRRADAAAEQSTESESTQSRLSERTSSERPTDRFDGRDEAPELDESHDEGTASFSPELRPRPSPFSRSTDERQDDEDAETDEREPERGTSPSGPGRRQPGPFSARDEESDDDVNVDDQEDESSDSERSVFSNAIRPSPFIPGGLREDAKTDDGEDRGIRPRSSETTPGRFQPSPNRLTSNRPSGFSGVRPSPKLGSRSTDEEDEDQDDQDITYEDVEDSV